MPVKIGFLVHRNIYYKHFGPVIDEALKRGNQVFCLHDYSQPTSGSKVYQFPAVEQTPRFQYGRVEAIPFSSSQELLEKVKQHNIQVVVSLCIPQDCVDLKHKFKEIGVFWAALQSGCDSLAAAELWTLPDVHLVYSQIWVDLALEYALRKKIMNADEFAVFKQKLREKVRIVGFPELDQRNMLNSDRIKKDWGIPQNKKVVLFLPFPFNSSNRSFWVSYIYGKNNVFLQLPLSLLSFRARYVKQVIKKWNDQNLVKSVRKFCDKNNAYLLVKSRKKDTVMPYLAKAADKILYDEEFYPATIIKCLLIADLCCNFYSTAVLEASLMGVSNVCIAPSWRDWLNLRSPLWKMFFEKANDLHNFPGVSYKLSIPEAMKAFFEKSFSDFPLDIAKQKEYVKKYIGNIEKSCSGKALEAIEGKCSRI